MEEVILAILGGSCGAAVVNGIFEAIRYGVARRENLGDKKDAQNKALRYLMLYIIQERARQHIQACSITLQERRSLHHWHSLYHDGLGGNGDADALMEQVDRLPVDTQH